MKKYAILLIGLFLTFSAVIGVAEEKDNHICFRALDADKDGLVTLQEFERYYEDSEEKFNQADADKNGKLTHEEYHDSLGHGAP